ncbi:HD domain-containing protein [Neolewinella lacunae]|uniref:HD domain-containing protein n=1 Tax=Neolewinella lacunae TaxID=1517758 RepID=A0A923PRH7_9BACT|nr:HD domain-containing protein [Neolewinella lacunae]MBC6995407.1 HD domain-containing protein [Neolewinella lacunae]MDN3633850.1 HD domain-containing protein [Neolewinella lacunae]
MASSVDNITYLTGRYVARLLISKLPADRLYHNLHHTINVVQGVINIGNAEKVSEPEMETLLLAAWFHDVGHIKTYEGHEVASAEIARDFLLRHDYPAERMAAVARCILATTMPQRPESHLEEIICDADMYHLSLVTYEHAQELLREEWSRVLGKVSSDEDWERENQEFLHQHHYFTHYGQTVLQPRKEKYGLEK